MAARVSRGAGSGVLVSARDRRGTPASVNVCSAGRAVRRSWPHEAMLSLVGVTPTGCERGSRRADRTQQTTRLWVTVSLPQWRLSCGARDLCGGPNPASTCGYRPARPEAVDDLVERLEGSEARIEEAAPAYAAQAAAARSTAVPLAVTVADSANAAVAGPEGANGIEVLTCTRCAAIVRAAAGAWPQANAVP